MNINFKNVLILAPLAGWTDYPFRKMIKGFGVDITVSEMMSSHALIHNKSTLKLISKSPEESPYAVQISANNVEIASRAIEQLNECEGIDIIDLNCGCPSPKVSGHGSGSGLLKDLPLLLKILEAIKIKSNKRYLSAKFRIGFKEAIPDELSRLINDSPLDFVTIHARTKIDKFNPLKINYEALGTIKSNISIPLIANGDINSCSKALEILKLTKADGLMIGRAALERPWIFSEIKDMLNTLNDNNNNVNYDLGYRDNDKRRQLVLNHLDSIIDFYGERGVILFRKNLHLYVKGYANASDFKRYINTIRDVDILRNCIKEFFGNTFVHQS